MSTFQAKKFLLVAMIVRSAFAVPYEQCFTQASLLYKVPKEVLIAIADVESHYNKNALNYNKNGTFDIGIMQINSSWFTKLSKIGIVPGKLKDPCQNIYVGAWILANNIQAYGFKWEAIQKYNGNDTQLRYATKIYTRLATTYPTLTESSQQVSSQKHPKPKFLYIH